MIDPELERYLGGLARALRRLGRRERERALREAQDHILCATDALQRAGPARDEALRSAIAAFGSPEAIAAGYARRRRTRPALLRAGSCAVVAAVAALAFAPTGSRLGQTLISTSHAADGACAGRWNQSPIVTGFRRAFVPTSHATCEVVLHDARTARIFRLDARDGRWRAIVPPGRSTWPVAQLSPRTRTHPYAVSPGGRLDRRIG